MHRARESAFPDCAAILSPTVPITRYLGLAFAALFALPATTVRAEGQGLRLERQLQPLNDVRGDLPLYVFGRRIDAVGDEEIEVIGGAELRKGDLRLTADRIRYFPRTDEVEATGSVRMHSATIDVAGPRLRIRVNDQIGILNSPRFQTPPRLPPGATPFATPVETRGAAEALRIEERQRYRMSEGTFTTCKPGDDDWYLSADRFDLDYIGNIGEARGAQLTFLGVRTPSIPWASFSLNNARKSGFLPPTFGLQGKVGAEITVPYYLNLAPNYDDTFSPRLTAKRGMQLGDEFRYLEPWGSGVLNVEYLPHDPVYNGDRYGLHTEDSFRFTPLLSGGIHFDKVSDNSYFRDLSTSLPVATQVYLDQSVFASYVLAPGWAAGARLQHTQLLPDVTSTVPPTPQYDRLPQLTLSGVRPGILGSDFVFAGELVKFQQSNAPVGERLILNPSLTFPFLTPGFYFKPKIGLHYTQYRLSDLSASPDPSVQVAGSTTPRRVLPITSIDSGLVFERPVTWQGRELSNTLEPRVFYVYIPYHNQEGIPVFDSSIPDLNYATLFTENYYTGGDRISDANQLTTAVTSRLIRADTGQEVLRGFIGQRLYFSSQRVALGASYPVRTDSSSSIVLGGSGQVLPHVTVDATGVFSSADHSAQRLSAGIRYQPEPGKVLSLSYRYIDAALNQVTDPLTGTIINQALKQIDVSGQWPVYGNFYAVGRYNYSVPDRTATEAVAGFEYNAGCWIVRAVTQSFTTGVSSRTRLFFLQLELNGFSKLGSNPLDVLRRSVSGYTSLNQRNVDLQQLNLYGD